MRRVSAAASSILRLRSHAIAYATVNGGSSSTPLYGEGLIRGMDCFALPSPTSSNLFHSRSSCSSRKRSISHLNRLVDELFISVSTKSDTVTDHRLHLNHALSLFDILLQTLPPSSSAPHLNPYSIVIFTKLLTVLTRLGCYSHAISLSRRLEFQGDVFTLSILINCFCHLNHLDLAMSVLGRILKLGFKPNTPTLNTLIKGFCSQGCLSETLHIFRQMAHHSADPCCQPNVITYNTIMDGLCKLGHIHTSLELFTHMQHANCKPDTVTYNAIIDAFCKDGHLNEALCLFSQMLSRGISPNVVTYTSFIHGASSQWNLATAFLNDMEDKNIFPNVCTYTVLVDTFCKEGNIEEARQVVNRMIERGCEPDTITYTALMHGYCLRGELDEALRVFRLMASHGCPHDVYSYNILINGYCKIKRMDEAATFFHEMCDRDLVPNTITYNTMISGFFNVEKLEAAEKLLHEMQARGLLRNKGLVPDTIAYTTLISGLFDIGKPKAVEKILAAEKLLHELLPSTVTLSVVLDYLCKSKCLMQAMSLVQKIEDYVIKPNIIRYNILVDGLWKAGKLEMMLPIWIQEAQNNVNPKF